MVYTRPQNTRKLDKTQKVSLVKEYIAQYEQALREQGVEALNSKIQREVFAPILNDIGEILLSQAGSLLRENEDVKTFLKNNPLPRHMAELLPEEFRVFSLLLNSLKQWVSAESAATDRFLLGGTARQTCRKAVTHCIITGEPLGDSAELHHPVRDGRPPVLLSKKGHEIVERAVTRETAGEELGGEDLSESQNELWQDLQVMRSQRSQSWVQLREGCLHLLNPAEPCRPGAKSFANVVMRDTGRTPTDVLNLLDLMGK
ncbi:conserved hypothetical protein [uncultured delta proteobacterium]|uniref:Uncharacterized protein n=1 Tax=uncultured delta proteobacterium TaxID=34034 RepID=A0A212J311_9DELT|nr:conserved hypothetical protein [uncultured delta proteobacterium]